MKIFISHASKNAEYGKALVKFLTDIGIPHSDVTFTSDAAYGIPAGEKIFDWLKERISEKPYVIYLISDEYYQSVACLNEMGAAWIVASKSIAIFTPEFDITTDNFRNGALDPRQMGFFINNEDRIIEFAETIGKLAKTSTKQVAVNRACRQLASDVNSIKLQQGTQPNKPQTPSGIKNGPTPAIAAKASTHTRQPTPPSSQQTQNKRQTPTERFFSHFETGKLKDEEILLAVYASETSRFSLGVGWREKEEIEKIMEWEDLNDFSNTLSENYTAAINRFEARNLTVVSEKTAYGNPRQIDFIQDFKESILDLPESFHIKSEEIIQTALKKKKEDNDPFCNF